jgi:hypothetical protein
MKYETKSTSSNLYLNEKRISHFSVWFLVNSSGQKKKLLNLFYFYSCFLSSLVLSCLARRHLILTYTHCMNNNNINNNILL